MAKKKSIEEHKQEIENFPELFYRYNVERYSKDLCDKLVEHMGRGFSYESFAGAIKVPLSTLEQWCDIHEEFASAKIAAFDQNRLFWENAGIVALTLGKSFNTTAWIFNMKNRHGWRDSMEISAKKKDPSQMTEKEVMEELEKIAKEVVK